MSADGGMSLLEVVISLSVSAIFACCLAMYTMSVWRGTEFIRIASEDRAMWDSVQRTLSSDCHRSVSGNVNRGVLTLRLVNGEQYRYVLNSSGELVRLGSQGGTSVIAGNVTGWQAAVLPSDSVYVQLYFKDAAVFERQFVLLGDDA